MNNSADNLLLSITIPTYKRCEMLTELLEIVVPEAERLGIEVCVVDNCSADGTAENLAVLAVQHPSIRYIINTETVSIDENMRLAMQMANGNYVFPLGDDDRLPMGSLSEILYELAHNEPDMLSLCGQSLDENFALRPIPQDSKNEFGTQFCDPRIALLKLNVQHFSSFVIKRDIIAYETFSRYLGTYHAYLGVVWEGLVQRFIKNGSVLIRCSTRPLVYLNTGVEKSWNSSRFEVFFVKVPQYLMLLPEALRTESSFLHDDWLRKYADILSFISLRRSNQLTQSNYREVQALLNRKSAREMALVMWLPMPLLKLSRSFIKRWRRLRTMCTPILRPRMGSFKPKFAPIRVNP